MARKDEAAELLKIGKAPCEIARQMDISVASVIQYLRTKVGEGTLRLSDIYFVFSPEQRDALKRAAKLPDRGALQKFLKAAGLELEEFALYQELNRRTTFAGDLYEYLSETELALHDMVATKLKQAYGESENGYWRRGVPLTIRTKCQDRRESDDEPCESAFQYTDLLDLYEIIAKNWDLFQNDLPAEYSKNRNTLKRDFSKLNWIRNSVMHPVKRRRWSEDDFQFAARLHAMFQPFRAN
jgi:hypothetical protein